jgi:PAS domain S-box-containing protein
LSGKVDIVVTLAAAIAPGVPKGSDDSLGLHGAFDELASSCRTDSAMSMRPYHPIRYLILCGVLLIVAIAAGTAIMVGNVRTSVFLSAGGLAAVTVAVMIFLIVRQLRQGHELSEQRLALEKQWLHTAINNMSQGLILFDSSERIVIFNQRYVEMYGLSTDVVRPGCAFRDLLYHRKATGSFAGDVDDYQSAVRADLARGKASEVIAQTADGRSIRIVNQPLATGGWVATHEDVTEPQRLLQAQNEAEKLVREQKLQLDAALDNMVHGLCMFDAEGRIILFNQRYVDMMGYSADNLMGLSLLDLFKRRKLTGKFTGDPEQFFAGVLASMRAGIATTKIMESDDGRALRVGDHPMANGGWVATFEDITEQRKVETERDRDREFLEQIINNVPSPIIVKDARTRRYVLVNQACEKYFGASRDQLVGKTAYDVWPETTADAITQHDEQLVQSNGYLFFDEHPLDTRALGTRIVTAKRLLIREGSGEPQYLLGVIEDVTERKRSDERIAHLAHYDALTDLPNRALFREQLEQSLKRVHQGEHLALLYLDLDHFKSVNDTLGHPVGDELLKAVAARLRGCLRETDLVARLGGDEFAVVHGALASHRMSSTW